MKNYLVLFFSSLCATIGFFSFTSNLYAAPLIDAGFKGTLWYSPQQTYENEPIRIYTAVYNQSPFDIIATIKLYEGNKLLGDTPLFLAQNTTFHQWFDVSVSSGTPTFVAVLSNSKKSNLGKELETVALLNTTSSPLQISIKTKPAAPKNSSITSTTNTSSPFFSTFTVSSDEQVNSTTSSTIVSSSTIFEGVVQNSSSFLNKFSEAIQPTITALTGNVKLHLANQKTKLDQELAENKNNRPVPLLEESAKRLEGKTTWLKIPREKIPSFKQLQSWSLGATLYILNTWWLMVLLLLVLFRALWKLWRFVKRGDNY